MACGEKQSPTHLWKKAINAICEEKLEELGSSVKVDDDDANEPERQPKEADSDKSNNVSYVEVVEFLGRK